MGSAGFIFLAPGQGTVLASMSDSRVNSDLKDAIEKEGNIDKLKDTTTTSGSGAAFSMSMDTTTTSGSGAAFSMSMYGIEKFNKDKLTHTQTKEKNVLPDAQTIQQEKEAATA